MQCFSLHIARLVTQQIFAVTFMFRRRRGWGPGGQHTEEIGARFDGAVRFCRPLRLKRPPEAASQRAIVATRRVCHEIDPQPLTAGDSTTHSPSIADNQPQMTRWFGFLLCFTRVNSGSHIGVKSSNSSHLIGSQRAPARQQVTSVLESALQMQSVVEPVARSTLGATPLLHVLVSLLAREATGTVVIAPPGGERSTLFIEGGVPTKLQVAEPVGRLSELLVSLGRLDSQTAQESFDEARSQKGLHGTHLLEKGLLDEETLLQTLRAQLTLKLGWAAALSDDTAVDLYANIDFLASWPRAPHFNSPLEAVWAMARNHVDLRCVAAVLRQIVHRPLRLHPRSRPGWFGFDPKERCVIECLADGSMDMQTLIQHVPVPARTVQVMLYVLTITRHLDLGQRKPPIGFEISGSGQRRRVDVASVRYDAIAPSGDVSDGKAHTVPPLPQEQDRVHQALRAAHAVRRAEYLLERNKLVEAEAQAKLALEYDPEHSEGRAVCAWIQACRLGEAADLARCLSVLNDALEQNPVDEKLRFRRARLLSRLGNVDEANHEFRLIVELNPGHIDAQRELRLWELRHRGKRPSSGEFSRAPGARVSERPPPPGLFG